LAGGPADIEGGLLRALLSHDLAYPTPDVVPLFYIFFNFRFSQLGYLVDVFLSAQDSKCCLVVQERRQERPSLRCSLRRECLA
jgi:hypothetical protein